MSLFKWSTPARKGEDHNLPLVPNEIYLHIFEHIAPPAGPLTSDELDVFTTLSGVCRFFANYCLPHIFEYLEFSGSVFCDNTPVGALHTTRKQSRLNTLCTQIAARQPLALALAKKVRVCHFVKWKLDDPGSWAVRLFAQRYTAGLSHMKNLRELKFVKSFVDVDHCRVVITLGSLDKLIFDTCHFLQDSVPLKVEPEARVKVFHLQVTDCSGNYPAIISTVHPRYLRTLIVDMAFSERVDWLSKSATLTELHLCRERAFLPAQNWYLDRLPVILARASPSLEVLRITLDEKKDFVRLFVQRIRSAAYSDPPETVVVSSILDTIGRLTNLRSFTLEDCSITPDISSAEIRILLQDKLGPESRLRHVDMHGTVYGLVDEKWTETAPGST